MDKSHNGHWKTSQGNLDAQLCTRLIQHRKYDHSYGMKQSDTGTDNTLNTFILECIEKSASQENKQEVERGRIKCVQHNGMNFPHLNELTEIWTSSLPSVPAFS